MRERERERHYPLLPLVSLKEAPKRLLERIEMGGVKDHKHTTTKSTSAYTRLTGGKEERGKDIEREGGRVASEY